ncbi:zinc ribbon domain-containing protein [Candidatus Micrarchaeota archaeon]|nr:zinc ribbon domain-containing protein [Candidatus Micrarchaeota archaeon]
MGFLDNVVNKVKDDLSWKAGQEISSGIAGGAKKAVKGDPNAKKKCPKCKKQITDSSLKFCPHCGTKLFVTCGKCNIDYPVGTKFCTQCGGKL